MGIIVAVPVVKEKTRAHGHRAECILCKIGKKKVNEEKEIINTGSRLMAATQPMNQ